MATLTVFPDAGDPGTTSVDGQVRRQTVDQTLANIRSGAGNNHSSTDTDMVAAYLAASTTTNQFQRLVRGIFLFDTSALGAGATISAAIFSLYGNNGTLGAVKVGDLGTTPLHVAGSTPASNTTLADSDYGQCQTTTFGNIAYASFTINQYNDISLNASGQSNISLTGVSKFSTQLEWDINNSFGGTWVSGQVTAFDCNYADQAGTTQDPKLVVTYTPAAGFPSILTLVGVGI